MKFHKMQVSLLPGTYSLSTQSLLYYKQQNQSQHSNTVPFSTQNRNTLSPVFFLSVPDASSCILPCIKPSTHTSHHHYAGQLVSAEVLPLASSEGEFSLGFW
jgi:hypothetical protein